jgi:trehalose 6-phosphate synthase
LILSRFAGAAHELDGAILVNPYDTEACAAAIARALRMPLEERRERWDSMMARLRTNTVEAWCQHFLSSLSDTSDKGLEPHTPTNVENGRYPFSEAAPA